MEQIIKIYELNVAKDIMPSAMGDVEELQAVTKRIYDIFVGLIERTSNLMKDRDGILKEEIDKKNRSITLVQEKLDKTLLDLEAFRAENDSLNGKYQELKEEISSCDGRMKEQERNHRELLNSKDALIQEYREKNDTLNSIVSEYQEYKEQNKELVSKLSEALKEIDGLKKQVRDKERAEEKVLAEHEKLKAQNEIAVQRVQMEKEKAILELREKHQSRIEELNASYNAKIEEYNKRVKDLLDGREPTPKMDEKIEKGTRKKS